MSVPFLTKLYRCFLCAAHEFTTRESRGPLIISIQSPPHGDESLGFIPFSGLLGALRPPLFACHSLSSLAMALCGASGGG